MMYNTLFVNFRIINKLFAHLHYRRVVDNIWHRRQSWGVGGPRLPRFLARVVVGGSQGGRRGGGGGGPGGGRGGGGGAFTGGKILLYLIMYRKYVRKW